MSLQEASSQVAPSEKPIKIIIYFNVNDDFKAKQDFVQYWDEVHGPKCAKMFAKYGMISYKQIRLPKTSPYVDISKGMENGPYKLSAPQYDGGVEMIVPNTETMHKIVSDPEYQEKIRPAEEAFISFDPAKKSMVVVGYEETFVEGGKQIK